MKTLKLSEIESRILYITLMDASASVLTVAKRLNAKPHIVQAAVRKFRSEGLIAPRTLVNIAQLGFASHELFVSLSSEGQRVKGALIEYLSASPWIGSILEVGGDYDLMVTVRVRSQKDMLDFQSGLGERFPGAVSSKDTSMAVEHWLFGEKFLVNSQALYRQYHLPVPSHVVTIDALDRRILFEMGDSEIASISALGRKLGIAATTVEYRIKKLKERGVVVGQMHEVRGGMLGLSYYVCLVSIKSSSESLNHEFCELARLNPWVPWLSRGTGRWDYVMGIAVREPSEAHAAVSLFQAKFGDWIVSYRILPMFKAHKVRDYPFDPASIAAQGDSLQHASSTAS
jgi:DNA-binding Lrp family transcriptional regulator